MKRAILVAIGVVLLAAYVSCKVADEADRVSSLM